MTLVRRAALLSAGILALALVCRNDAIHAGEPPADDAPTQQAAPRNDFYGDPLPDGAIARLGTLRFRTGGIAQLAFSPDGKLLASAGADGRTGEACALWFWEVGTGRLVRRLADQASRLSFCNAVAFSPDGKALAEAGGKGDVRLRDLATGKELLRLDMIAARCVAFSPDGKTLATVGGVKDGDHGPNAQWQLWDVRTGGRLLNLGPCDPCLAFSPTGAAVATTFKGMVQLWNPANGDVLRRIDAGPMQIYALTFSPDGRLLTTGNGMGALVLWDPRTGAKVRSLSGHEGAVCFAAFAPDGKTLVTGDSDGVWMVWDVASGEQLRQINKRVPGYSFNEPAALSPDGKHLAVGDDTGVRFWDVSTGKEEPRLPSAFTCGLALSPDGKMVAGFGQSDPARHHPIAVRLWDVEAGKVKAEWESEGEIGALAFSADGRVLASAGRALAAWEVESGKNLFTTAGVRKEPLTPPAFSPDGRTITLLDREQVVRVDAATGKVSGTTPLEKTSTYKGALSADGKVVAFIPQSLQPREKRDDRTPARLCDARTGRLLQVLQPQPDPDPGITRWLSLAPDGTLLATGVGRQTVYLWRASTGHSFLWFPAPETWSWFVFSPDGKLLAVAGNDSAVHLWETQTGAEVRQFDGHRGWVQSIAFSADGRRLASGGRDMTIVVWDVAGGQADPSDRLKTDDLERRWTDLGGDAPKAFRARQALTAAAKQSAPFLLERLAVPAAPPGESLTRRLADLDADDYQTREKASTELAKMGYWACPALREAKAARPSAEATRRIDALLAKLEDAALRPEEMRVSRAVAALECASVPEARDALEQLAKGPPAVAATEEAKAALARLSRLAAAP